MTNVYRHSVRSRIAPRHTQAVLLAERRAARRVSGRGESLGRQVWRFGKVASSV